MSGSCAWWPMYIIYHNMWLKNIEKYLKHTCLHIVPPLIIFVHAPPNIKWTDRKVLHDGHSHFRDAGAAWKETMALSLILAPGLLKWHAKLVMIDRDRGAHMKPHGHLCNMCFWISGPYCTKAPHRFTDTCALKTFCNPRSWQTRVITSCYGFGGYKADCMGFQRLQDATKKIREICCFHPTVHFTLCPILSHNLESDEVDVECVE